MDAIRWETPGGFPSVGEHCNGCGLCVRVCGGADVDVPRYARRHYGRDVDLRTDAVGPVRECCLARSTDPSVVAGGASGGLVTQVLLGLFEREEIDGAVVCGYSRQDPLTPEAFVARSREDVLSAAQSKYVIFPVAHTYAEILRVPGRYAVVGLPCHFHSLFRWMEVAPKLRERVVLKIGLACHTNLSMDVVPDLLKLRGIEPSAVAKVEFRGGAWPGGIRVHTRGGEIRGLHQGDIKDGAFNFLNRIYRLDRCLLCIDYGAELADFAVADPWIRGRDGGYRYPGGWSVAMVRTERGAREIRQQQERGLLDVKPLEEDLLRRNSRAMTLRKKRGAFLRLAARDRAGRPCPVYHLEPPEISWRERVSEGVFGISLRITRFPPLRPVLLWLCFSSAGAQFARWKAAIKAALYRRRRPVPARRPAPPHKP